MGEPRERAEAGRRRVRTRLRLQPVKYRIQLVYLGHDRIAHDNARYRCEYELEEVPAPMTSPPEPIPNVVRRTAADDVSDRAARPLDEGGDNGNPPRDMLYRIIIRDNHALRDADENLLDHRGNNRSRSDSYRNLGWLPDVRPAVPFRVVVRKFVGDRQVDIEDGMWVLMGIKDPVEEFDRNSGRPRTFLERFFATYNRTDADPDPGDDNAPRPFDGGRRASAANGGVRAADVLRSAPYVSPPVADSAPSRANAVPFGRLAALGRSGPARRHGQMNARFNLTRVTDDDHQVGVAEIVLYPWPQSGDNYRFLLTLRNSDDADVRTTRMNGAPVQLTDDMDVEIPRPRAYVTGRFVIWKRVDVKLLVRVNNTANADVTWGAIRAIYRHDFIEVGGPEISRALTQAAWRAELRNEYQAAVAGNAALRGQLATDATVNATYNQQYIPPFLHNVGTLLDHVEGLSRRIIRNACGAVAPPLEDPRDNRRQRKNNALRRRSQGLYIVLFRLTAPDFTAGGQYMGDRSFWLRRRNHRHVTTSTCAHEMGHGFYLRHSHTAVPRDGDDDMVQVTYVPAGGGAGGRIVLIQGHDGDYLEDHDQADGFACLMSYARARDARPCGMCNLALRLYDRVAIQQPGRYRNRLMQGLSPLAIVRVETPAADQIRLSEDLPNLNVGQAIQVMAVGCSQPVTLMSGTAGHGRVNLSRHRRARWRVTGAAWQLRPDRVRIRATGAGRIRINFTCGSLSADAEIQVNA
jgi:hypothetical protein